MYIKRLQGLEWTNYKKNNKLVLLAIGKSSHGNYVSYTIDAQKRIIRHWLGFSEVVSLESSGWLDNHTVYNCNDLYKKSLLNDLIKERLEERLS